MNVRELIEALQQVPLDTPVVTVCTFGHEVEKTLEFVVAGEIGGGIMQVELS